MPAEPGSGDTHQDDESSRWKDIPLFPLNTVLFPGMVLPLHIFEERYKLMINRCLEEERPFGVLLIDEGSEVGGGAVPFDVGTTTVIAGVSRLSGGRMNIVTIGSERFRLRSVRYDLPYLVGDGEPWPLAGATSREAAALVEPVRAAFTLYLDLLERAQGHRITIADLPDDPQSLALTVAVALQVPLRQKQELLSRPAVAHMLALERAILARERLILDTIVRTQAEQWEGGYSGYLARN